MRLAATDGARFPIKFRTPIMCNGSKLFMDYSLLFHYDIYTCTCIHKSLSTRMHHYSNKLFRAGDIVSRKIALHSVAERKKKK